MRTRTEDEMLRLITRFAGDDSRIRAVVMNGSRVNPAVAADPFQDFDIVNLVTDVEPFRNADYVIPRFGPIIVVEQPLIGPWPPGDGDDACHNYNIQFLDGNRIDLSFVHVDRMKDLLTDSLTTVLLDKDGRIPALPPPDERSYFITEPTLQRYEGCCDAFYFAVASHIPKAIWRRQLPRLKYLIESWLRQPVTMMFEWEIGIRSGWEKSLGPNGKDLERHVSPDRWRDYTETYVDADYGRLWDSLFRFLELFNESARYVARKRGYGFPEETAVNVAAFLSHLRTLPADAKAIY
jgi:aminoglycoside 6-adenylyltransferase